MKNIQRPGRSLVQTLTLAVFALLFLPLPAFCLPGPPPLPPIQLNWWVLAGPNWPDIFGDAPPGFTNLNTAPGWSPAGTALSVDTNCPAFLNLSVIDKGEPNISLTSGTIFFWFQPNYTSVPDGGDGPTHWASLLTIGQWTSNAAASCWSLAIDPDGTNLIFLAQSNGAEQIVLTAPIDFDAGDWHSVCLTYSPANGCCLYLEGQPVTNAGAIACIPSDNDCAVYGFSIGSEGGTNGVFQARGQFQDLQTYDGPLSAAEIAQDYADTSAIILNSGGSLPASGGFHPDDGAAGPGGGTGGSGSGSSFFQPSYVITSNYLNYTNFWLAVTNSAMQAFVSVVNTLPGLTYEIMTNAAPTTTNWGVWQTILASNSITPAPPMDLNSNALFFKGVLLGYLGPNAYYPGANTNGAPSIITQPASQLVNEGSSATFSVMAVGATPLSCQWSFDGTNIGGATASSYTISDVQAADVGWYVVVVTNMAGSVTSAVATLATSTSPPCIITQPVSQTNNDGSAATFSVLAIGALPLNYQWSFSGTNTISDATNIPGATNSSLVISDVQATNKGNYVVVVTNLYGSVTSVVVTLTRSNAAPTFVYEPISQTVVEGDTVTFSARAVGTEPITNQWQVFSNGAFTNLQGQTNTHWVDVNMQPGDAGIYAFVVANSVGTNSFTNAVLTDASSSSYIYDRSVMPVFGPRQDYTFQACTTYYIGSNNAANCKCTNFDFYGTTRIEGGAVIKFDNNSYGGSYHGVVSVATLVLHGPLVCDTAPYNPAILTSVDDDSQGELPYVYWFDGGGYVLDFHLVPPVTAANGYAYLNLDDVHDTNGTSLNYLRFCYADQAVTTPTNSGALDVWNCQFLECNSALNSWARNSASTNRLHNVLFSRCNYVFSARTNLAELDGEQMTADVFSFWNPVFAPGEICLTNSIVMGEFGGGLVTNNQNVAINPNASPFEAGDDAFYYLATNSACSGAGTTNISGPMLQQLWQKTTVAPISLPVGMGIDEMTFFPAAKRYGGGAPDLGYYYDPLDYTVASLIVTNKVTILPGTAIGFRNDWFRGFVLWNGSSFVAQGTPTDPVVFSDIAGVQEGPLLPGNVYQPDYPPVFGSPGLWDYGGIDFICPMAGTDNDSSSPTLDLRFCNFYSTADDFPVWAGAFSKMSFYISPTSLVEWNMQDCTVHGGNIVLGPHIDFSQTNFVYIPGSVSWTNNLFDAAGVYLEPSLDLSFYAVNNLFKGGSMMLIPPGSDNWILRNTLFDSVVIVQDLSQLVDADHNGYWPARFDTIEEDNLQFDQEPLSWQVVLELVNNDGSNGPTGGDQILTNPPPYQVGPFGNYYMAPGMVLAGTGSTNANLLGLYYYTTATNQALQGDGIVDIGLHYVAASSNLNGWVPLETNGIPDYIADVNGNGIIPPDATNAYSDYYTNIDLADDGMVGLVKSNLNNLNPLVFDNPLTLTQKVTGQEPAIVTLEVGVSNSLVQSIGQLVLMVDGVPQTTNQPTQVAGDGNSLLVWNTTASTNFPPGQTYFLQAHLTLSGSGVSADGPLIAFNLPAVGVQPASQTNGLGGTVTFTSSTTGPGPYTYQWYDGSSPITGATNSTYTITNLVATNGGSYTVVVTNAEGDPFTST